MSLTANCTIQLVDNDTDWWAELTDWQTSLFMRAAIEAKDARIRAIVAEIGDALRAQQGVTRLPEWAPWVDAMSSPEELMQRVWESAVVYSPYAAMSFETPRGVNTVRYALERPEGRWQSTLYVVDVDPDYGVDDRDQPLPAGLSALTWRAPHQTAPALAHTEIGVVFQREEHLTVCFMPDVIDLYGIDLKEVEAYAREATGNY